MFDLHSHLGKFKRALQALRLITPFVKQYRWRLVSGFLSLAAVDFLQLWIPRITKLAVDSLQMGVATPLLLLQYGGFMILLAFSLIFFRFSWRYLIIGFSRLLEKHLRTKLLSHVLTLDRIFFQKKTTGEIMALATNDLASVQLACGMGLIASADAVFMSVATIGFMIYIHPGLTLMTVLPMPILVICTSLLSARLHRRFSKVQEQFSRMTEFARTSLTGIRLIKAYTQEEQQTGRFDLMGREYVKDNLRLAVVQGTLFPFAGLIANCSLLIVIFFGGRLTITGIITIGDFVAFMSYLFMLAWPMMALGWVANLFQRGITSLDRLQAVFQARPLLTDPADPLNLEQTSRKISIRNLTFSYNGQTTPALEDISLEITPGILGIVGRTGSGKSTLCHILSRLYPIDPGHILIDGIEINRLSLTTVRSQIAYVPQDVILFAETIAENIALGRSNATTGMIESVARAAMIHDEICAMPNGYETKIGERGIRLSGGQRQRITLARALLLDRPIILIDDGLSAVDTQTEHAIIDNLTEFLQNRTCIVVSHRLAPLAGAREILVMDSGRIVSRGTHEQLLRENDFYRAIYHHQTFMGEKGLPDTLPSIRINEH